MFIVYERLSCKRCFVKSGFKRCFVKSEMILFSNIVVYAIEDIV